MRRKYAGLMLILMMLGHNYVINQPQSLQHEIQQIHNVNVTQFNLLYSIPSILAILTIIPVGVIYLKYPNFTLMFGITMLFIGQLLASMFGSQGKQYYFGVFVGGRTLQASGAQILYMIQGNLASSWMGNFAGLVFILPQIGQIINAFLTPYAAIKWGPKTALLIGVIFCSISMVACCYLYCDLKKRRKVKSSTTIQMTDQNQVESKQTKTGLDIEMQSKLYNQHLKISNQQSSRQNISQVQQKSVQTLKSISEHQTKDKTSDQELTNNKQKLIEPQSIFKAGKIFWLTITICAINQCLYFPFLDNANELIQTRFKIPYSETGYFLCLPFCAAILTTMAMSKVLALIQRKNIIFYSSILPFFGHLMIMMLPNCEQESLSGSGKILLGCGFFIFGSGIGAYYSVSFPAVGMAVPQKIRGFSYGVLCFFQTIAMSLVPILSGLIIEQDIANQIQGYRNSSMMFVGLTLLAIVVAFSIKWLGNQESYRYDDEQELVQQEESALQQMEISSQNIEFKIKKKAQTQYEVLDKQQTFNEQLK